MGKAIALNQDTFWVGAVDWNARYFHGAVLSTHRGTTYNSYLLRDQKTALIDTVYPPFADDLVQKIKSLIRPEELDYLVINHVEIDHSGSFPVIRELCPRARVVCTQRGYEGLQGYFGGGFEPLIVKTGDTISLGRRTLQFIEAPMLHWPDSMFTYVPEDSLLLPNDAFGQHIATASRFDDEVDMAEVMQEAAKYYANILMPFGSLVSRKLAEINKLGLSIKMIAPSHGIIWRGQPERIVEAYARWAEGLGRPLAVVAYDTMWQSTERMAMALLDGLEAGGVEAKLYKLSSSDRNDVIAAILEARAVLIGSPTINNDILPTVSPLLDDLMGLRPRNKLGMGFGSYGWGGGAQQVIEERLKAAKFEVIEPGITAKWRPTAEDAQRCFERGREVAERIKQ